jgi:hypothetical protein
MVPVPIDHADPTPVEHLTNQGAKKATQRPVASPIASVVRRPPLRTPRRSGGGNGVLVMAIVVLMLGAISFGGAMFHYQESSAQVWGRLSALLTGHTDEAAPVAPVSSPIASAPPQTTPSPRKSPAEPTAPENAAVPVAQTTENDIPSTVADDDALIRNPIIWLLENHSHWPRGITLTKDVALSPTNTFTTGTTVPLGKIIDVDSLVILIDGKGFKIPVSATDLMQRAQALMSEADAAAMAAAPATAADDAAPSTETAVAVAVAPTVATPAPEAPVLATAQPFNGRLTAANFRTKDYPRVFVTKDMRPHLLAKIRSVDWAQAIYADILRRATGDMERHQHDPQWLVSRLCLNWGEGKHYTTFVPKNGGVSEWSGNAPYPTAIPECGRVGGGDYNLDLVRPYNDQRTTPQRRDGKIVEVPYTELGRMPNQQNGRILDMAYSSAIVYFVTNDRRYAKMAADVFWTFCRGLSYQDQLDPQAGRSMMGLLGFETLGDSRYLAQVPLIYDLLHDYLHNEYFLSPEFLDGRPGERWAPGHRKEGGKAGAKGAKKWAVDRIHLAFQKMMDNKLNRGGALLGNWNTNEHMVGLPYALAMDDDQYVANHQGREYYVGKFLIGPTTDSHGAFLDVPRANLSSLTGLWPEPPAGYGQGSIAQLVQFGFWYYMAGIDVMDKDPILRKAAMSFPQMAFPNGLTTCWGDGGYAPMKRETAEYMIAYARAKKDHEMERNFTALLNFTGGRGTWGDQALFFYVPTLEAGQAKAQFPRVSFSETHSIFFARNIVDKPEDGLAYTVYGHGAKSGHSHYNGLAMELYGRGIILGLDPGAGPHYWHPQHAYYNRAIAAHNTVVPNGMVAPSSTDIVIENAEPMPVPGERPKTELSKLYQFSDVSALAGMHREADQRRTQGIVRTSPGGGFYVDIFRSHMRDKGKDTRHDYLYHNIGKKLELFDDKGAGFTPNGPDFDKKSGPGYEFFTGYRGADYAKDFSAVFSVINDVTMRLWMIGQAERTIYPLTGPMAFRHHLHQLGGEPVPTILVRQKGEAWLRPFIAVYEASDKIQPPTVARVRRMKGAPDAGDFVGIAVEHGGALTGRTDYVVNATNLKTGAVCEDVRFQGIYGVVTMAGKDAKAIYLGAGIHLSCKKLALQTPGVKPTSAGTALLKASLWRDDANLCDVGPARDTGHVYSAESDVLATIPVVLPATLANQGLTVCYATDAGLVPALTTAVATDYDGSGTLLITALLPTACNARLYVMPGAQLARR